MTTTHADAIGLPAAIATLGRPSLADVEARLIARGLLRKQATGDISVEDSRITPVMSRRLRSAGNRQVVSDRHWAETALDRWDLAPGREQRVVECPQCRGKQEQPLDCTRFTCSTCVRSWRWAMCDACDVLTLAVERQESWRCGGCGGFTRSWWRTVALVREARFVVDRRRAEVLAEERAIMAAGVRRRRWLLTAFAIAAAVVGLLMVRGAGAASSLPRDATASTCAHMARIQSNLVANRLPAAHLANEVNSLVAETHGGGTVAKEVVVAIGGFRSAGPPGSSSFLLARTAVVDACSRVAN